MVLNHEFWGKEGRREDTEIRREFQVGERKRGKRKAGKGKGEKMEDGTGETQILGGG